MRLLILSDSHGRSSAIREAIEAQPEAKTVFYLGDGLRDLEEIQASYRSHTFYCVRGNCDWAVIDTPEMAITDIGGVRIFYTHGHVYDAKFSLTRAALAAREREAQVLLFGHTHQPLSVYDDGLYVVNPGSIGKGHSYAILDITPAGIVPGLRSL